MTTTKGESALHAARACEYAITAQQSDAAAFQRMREQYAASIPAYEEEQKQKKLQRAGMSAEQRKRHEALDFARANVELSGGKISEEDARHALRWANGDITMDEYLDAVRSKIAPT
ncbi:antitoxin VbhA family protein [Janthinobacterium sp. J1-1]|uniref:antitoxin VbhA family protein n=1 Tax=Janthinobacterium sp. J1-1 TaxID=3065910 RepID=UPI00281234C6|nr:antitoxin VbhA family protein [Janthinobacterium sp. J1-1]